MDETKDWAEDYKEMIYPHINTVCSCALGLVDVVMACWCMYMHANPRFTVCVHTLILRASFWCPHILCPYVTSSYTTVSLTQL